MLGSRKERELQVIKKAWEDPEFKAKLLSGDAKAVIAQEAGLDIPEDIEIQVIEEKPGTMVFVLPRDVSSEVGLAGALSDDDLENVAGGKGDHTSNTCSTSHGGSGQNTQVIVDM